MDLSNAEASELTFAAFYADCEHAIKPITQGSRVCLTYNLLQRRNGNKNKPIAAPLYDRETDRAGAILEQNVRETRRTREAGLAARTSLHPGRTFVFRTKSSGRCAGQGCAGRCAASEVRHQFTNSFAD